MTCNILRGNIFLKMHRLKEAESIFMKDIEKLSLKERQGVYHKLSLLKKEKKDFNPHVNMRKRVSVAEILLR